MEANDCNGKSTFSRMKDYKNLSENEAIVTMEQAHF